jgi:hypothetical protein
VDLAEPEDADRGSAVAIGPASQLPEGYLDIYKLAVEMADRVSARRAVASSYFLTAQAGLVVLIGATSTASWAYALPGIVLAATWWLLLRSYRTLNGAKFKIIQTMEERLPAAPLKDEWVELQRREGGRWHGRYFELGLVERVVPAVFGIIFLVVLVTELL